MIAAVCLVAFPVFAATSNLVVNGDFEQHGGAGTNKLTAWTIVDQGGPGSWYAQTGDFPMPSSQRCSGESVGAPPSGFAAMSNQSYKGSHVLYQDVAIPQATGKITLSYDLFINTHAAYATQPTLDYTVFPNTQLRIDVMDPAAAVDDTGAGVLMNLYQSSASDQRYIQYKRHTADLTAYSGRSIRLRFAEVDNVDCFNAGVDNVSITIAGECPSAAPSGLAINYSCPTGCDAGQPVSFVATADGYTFSACDAYVWEFGDGASAATATPAHVFNSPGTYVVNLNVTNALGTSTASASVTVTAPQPRRRTIRR